MRAPLLMQEGARRGTSLSARRPPFTLCAVFAALLLAATRTAALSPNAAAAPSCNITAHAGDVTVPVSCFLASGKYTLASLTVAPRVTVYFGDAVELQVAGAVTVSENATLDASEASDAGPTPAMTFCTGTGGCHAGCPNGPVCGGGSLPDQWRTLALNAAVWANETWSAPYGSWYAPRTRGARGCNGTTSLGVSVAHYGAGGGALTINASSLLLGRGSRITVDGGKPRAYSPDAAAVTTSGGGGAGGSLYIVVSSLQGLLLSAPGAALPAPALSAAGGFPPPVGVYCVTSSVGGGGRIALVCASCAPALEALPLTATTAIPPRLLPNWVGEAAAGTLFLSLGGAAFLIVEGSSVIPCAPPMIAGIPPPGYPGVSALTSAAGSPGTFTFAGVAFKDQAARLHLSTRGGWNSTAGGWASGGTGGAPSQLTFVVGALSYADVTQPVAPGLLIEEGVTLRLLGGEQPAMAAAAVAAGGTFPGTLPAQAAAAPACPGAPLTLSRLYLLPAYVTFLGTGVLAFPNATTLAPAAAASADYKLSLEASPAGHAPFRNVTGLYLFGPSVLMFTGPGAVLPCLRLRGGAELRLSPSASALTTGSIWVGPQGTIDATPTYSVNVSVGGDLAIAEGGLYTVAGAHAINVSRALLVASGGVLAGLDGGLVRTGMSLNVTSGMGGCHGGCGALGAALTNDVCRAVTVSGSDTEQPRVYGFATAPVNSGACGQRPGMTYTGGAAISVTAASASINGTVTVSAPEVGALPGTLTAANTMSGGAAGSFLLRVGYLAYSTGNITADGAAAPPPSTGGTVVEAVGGGGGGRIAIVCSGPPSLLAASPHGFGIEDPQAWPLGLSASGGVSNTAKTAGGPGSVYVACTDPQSGVGPTLLVRQPRAASVAPTGARIYAAPSLVLDPPRMLAPSTGRLGRLIVTGGLPLIFTGTQLVSEAAGDPPAAPPTAEVLTLDAGSSVSYNYSVVVTSSAGVPVTSTLAGEGIAATLVRVLPAPGDTPPTINGAPPPCPSGALLGLDAVLKLLAPCTLWGNYSISLLEIAAGVTVRVGGSVTIVATGAVTLGPGAVLDGTGGARGAPPWAPPAASNPVLTRAGIGGCHASCGDSRVVGATVSTPAFSLAPPSDSCTPAARVG